MKRMNVIFADETDAKIRDYLYNEVDKKYVGFQSPFVEFAVLELFERLENDKKFEKEFKERLIKEKERRDQAKGWAGRR